MQTGGCVTFSKTLILLLFRAASAQSKISERECFSWLLRQNVDFCKMDNSNWSIFIQPANNLSSLQPFLSSKIEFSRMFKQQCQMEYLVLAFASTPRFIYCIQPFFNRLMFFSTSQQFVISFSPHTVNPTTYFIFSKPFFIISV